LEIKESKLDNARIRLDIEVPTERIDSEYAKVLKDVQKKAEIKGFRVGKAPIDLVEKKYSDYVLGETAENIVRSAYVETIEQKGYTPVSQPVFDFENVEKGKPFSFKVEFDITPSIEIGQYKGIQVEQKVVKVTDEDVEAEIETMREKMATVTKKEGDTIKVQKGDQVTLKMKRIDDKSKEEIDAAAFTSHNLIVGKSKESWAIDDDIIGMKKDEEKEIKVKYPKDYEVDDLKGQKVTYLVKVEEIFEFKLPELTDDFAKSVGEYNSVNDLRNRIRENLETYAKSQTLNETKNKILETIVENSKFDIPQSLLQKEMFAIFRRLQSRFGNVGNDINEFASIFGIDPEYLSKSIRDEAEKNIKNAMALSKIAELESLKVSEEQFQKFIKSVAERNGVSEEEVVKTVEEKGNKEEIEGDLILDSAYDFIYEHADIKMSKPITFQEYVNGKNKLLLTIIIY
jgi:trigger factor